MKSLIFVGLLGLHLLVCLRLDASAREDSPLHAEVCRFIISAPPIETLAPQVEEAFGPGGPRYVMLDVRDWVGSLGDYLKTKTVKGSKSAKPSHALKDTDPELFVVGKKIEEVVLTLATWALPNVPIYGNTFFFRMKGQEELSSFGWHRHRTRPLFATLEFASRLSTRVRRGQVERGWLFIADGQTEHRAPEANPEARVTWVDFFSLVSATEADDGPPEP
ncbi:MAG: hypothetical protein KDD39_03895 [Bdellovibrionales bacterium]|nr:hypothetical protein [Bdellovibrionales bacterium]